MADTKVKTSKTPHDLRPVNRFITDHNTEGKAVFSTALAEEIPVKTVVNGTQFRLGYTTEQFPVSFENDITSYSNYLKDAPGLVIPGGTVLRYVDFGPGSVSPMHRTVSLDYGVVLEGEVELILDSGEVRQMKRGDVAIQRGTMHAWRVPETAKTWARMLFVLQESQQVEVNGQKLGEDYGEMKGSTEVKPSERRSKV